MPRDLCNIREEQASPQRVLGRRSHAFSTPRVEERRNRPYSRRTSSMRSRCGALPSIYRGFPLATSALFRALIPPHQRLENHALSTFRSHETSSSPTSFPSSFQSRKRITQAIQSMRIWGRSAATLGMCPLQHLFSLSPPPFRPCPPMLWRCGSTVYAIFVRCRVHARRMCGMRQPMGLRGLYVVEVYTHPEGRDRACSAQRARSMQLYNARRT
ncbi:hypothetical protein B0H19DRAFT_69765 [Mycena capillaripes]|nr:hypothetical protein B0H19DRAFT_69765 [Mycena capillaripes]